MSIPTRGHAYGAVKSPSENKDDGLTEAPPPYESAAALTWERSTKVAMLPRSRPTDGSCYMLGYLDGNRHDHLMVRGSKKRSALPILGFRGWMCYAKTVRASRKPRYTDGDGNTTPLNAIGPGEVEVPNLSRVDWTRNWDFILSARSRAPKGSESWAVHVCLYFHDLSPSGSGSIPWNDTSRTRKVEGNALPSRHEANNMLKFTWKFCERSGSERPRWGASFTIYYKEGGDLAEGRSEYGFFTALDNPWAFFSPKNITQSELNHRTGAGRFKRLMWYEKGLGYGNDILNQPVRGWNDRQTAEFAEFVGCFFPRNT